MEDSSQLSSFEPVLQEHFTELKQLILKFRKAANALDKLAIYGDGSNDVPKALKVTVKLQLPKGTDPTVLAHATTQRKLFEKELFKITVNARKDEHARIKNEIDNVLLRCQYAVQESCKRSNSLFSDIDRDEILIAAEAHKTLKTRAQAFYDACTAKEDVANRKKQERIAQLQAEKEKLRLDPAPGIQQLVTQAVDKRLKDFRRAPDRNPGRNAFKPRSAPASKPKGNKTKAMNRGNQRTKRTFKFAAGNKKSWTSAKFKGSNKAGAGARGNQGRPPTRARNKQH
jgi:hypothetical protein